MNDAVLVSRRWLERVNERLFGSVVLPVDATAETTCGSLFYDVRLVSIRGVWAYADGVWTNTAAFIENDVVITGFTFPIYAPCYNGQQSTRPNVGGRSKAYAVWRGRWELLGNNASPTTYGAGVGMYATSSESDPNQTLLNTNAALSVVRRIENQGADTANPLSVSDNRIYVDGGCFKFTNVADFPCLSLQLKQTKVVSVLTPGTTTNKQMVTGVATKRITVITDITQDSNGRISVTYDSVLVIDERYGTFGVTYELITFTTLPTLEEKYIVTVGS